MPSAAGNHQKLEESRGDPLLETSEGACLANTSILDI